MVKRRSIRLSLVTLAALLALTASGCQEKPAYKKVRLASAGPELVKAPLPLKVPLRVAIAAVISPKETLNSYQALLDYLGERLGRPVELVQRQTYAEINDLVRAGGVDLAFVCTYAYVEGQKDFGMELLVVPQVRGETMYYSYIIVSRDSEIASIEGLRGRTFAFTDPLSNSGRLSPIYLLAQLGETPDSFFKKYVFTYSHDNSIKAVAEKLVDGAAVDSLVYEYTFAKSPQYSAKTRIIHKSSPYGMPPVVVHPALNKELKTQLRNLFLTMDQDPRGRVILDDLIIDRFVLANDADYDSIRKMVAAVRK